MEPKNLVDLNENPKNPRKMSTHDSESLQASLNEFGDLSPIVFNVRTQQLVGGHQRRKIMLKLWPQATIEMLQPYPAEPDEVGTIGLGFVVIGSKRFAYREVDWPLEREMAANIAANRIQGDMDLDLLSEVNYELSQLENGDDLLKQTGQTDKEVERLMKRAGVIEGDEQPAEDETDKPEKLEFALTRDQRLLIERTVELVKTTRDLQALETASLNGSALFVICQEYLQTHESEVNSDAAAESVSADAAEYAGLTGTPDIDE